MNKYTYLQPNETVMQIFIGPKSIPRIFKMTVVSSDEKALTVIPIGDAGEMTGKIVTYDDGVPRTYRPSEVDKMFADYLANIEGWDRAKHFFVTPESLAEEIQVLKKILAMWKATKLELSQQGEEPTPDAK